MIQGIIGKKLGMTQVFRENGTADGVTAIEAGPCSVVQVKTRAKEGYNALQLGFAKARRLNAPEKGHLRGLGDFPYLREIRVEETEGVASGARVDVSIFKAGDRVDVTGVTKGKGFAGVVKRYHFHGGPKTHGQSDRHRAPGTIGNIPGRVALGKTMAGHMGDAGLTVRGLEVVACDPERNLLIVKGSVPGGSNGLLIIRKSKVKGK